MAAFRKVQTIKKLESLQIMPYVLSNFTYSLLYLTFQGHVKVVQYIVKEVNQFPSDIECMRYIATIADKVRIHFLRCHLTLMEAVF